MKLISATIRQSATHLLAATAAVLLLTAAGPAASHTTKSGAKHSHATKQGHSMKKPPMKKSAAMKKTSSARMAKSGTCVGGGTWQDHQTCMKEAAAAKSSAERGRLATGEDANFARNRTLRCQGLPAADRDACVARMSQPSNVSGSVTEGGVLYEATQMVPASTTGGATMQRPAARPAQQPQRSRPMPQQQRRTN